MGGPGGGVVLTHQIGGELFLTLLVLMVLIRKCRVIGGWGPGDYLSVIISCLLQQTPTSKSAHHARARRTPYYSRLGTPGPRRSRMSKAYSTESNLALNTSPLKSARIKDDYDDLEQELDFDDDLDNEDMKTVI